MMRSTFYLLLFSTSMLLTHVTYPATSVPASNAEALETPGQSSEVKPVAPQKKPQHVPAGGKRLTY